MGIEINTRQYINTRPCIDPFECSAQYPIVSYRVEHEKRNSIFTSNQVFFFVLNEQNSPLPTRKVDFIKKILKMGKTISTILEEKSSSALSLRLKMEKCVESLQKQTMGVTFNPQKSQLFTFSLPTEEIF